MRLSSAIGVLTPSPVPSGPWMARPAQRPRIRDVVLPARSRPLAEMRVLDVTEWYGSTSGGIRTYLNEKSAYVHARPSLHQIMVVPGPEDLIDDQVGVRRYFVKGPRIPRHAPYRLMLSTATIERIVRHEQPHLIEVGSPFIVPWLVRNATQDLDIPLVYFHHSNVATSKLHGELRGAVTSGFTQALAGRYQRWLDELFPLTIAPSRSAMRELKMQGIHRVRHVPLGVDLELFTPARRAFQHVTRIRMALPDTPLVGFVGRFAPEKQLMAVLDAWPHIERRTGARLVLVGAGPLEAKLRRHPYAPRVYFRPFEINRAQLANLYAALDLCLAPGPAETFGLAALEAMASGTPVLAPNCGAGAELVEASGGGRLFAFGDQASLIDEAAALLRDDLVMLGRRGRRYAEQEHAWHGTFDRLFAIYRELMTR